MKVELKEVDNLTRELSIAIDAAQVNSEMEKKFIEVRSKVTLKGFRKGKAPMTVVKSMYAEQVKADVVDELIQSTYPEAVRENSLKVASRPMVTNLNFTDDGGLVYTAKVEILPEVESIDTTDIKISGQETEVTDAEVDEVMAHLRKRFSELRPVERPAQIDDVVMADLKKLADPSLALAADNFPNSEIDLGNNLTVKELREQLPGLKAGDEKEIEVVYPDDYSDATFAGARITYLCHVKAVKERILPELDDSFAKLTGQGETMLELRLKIRRDLGEHKKEQVTRLHKREVISQIIEKNQIPIPEGLVTEYLDSVVEDLKKDGQPVDEQEVRKHYHQIGVESMRWDFVWHKLADMEKIEVSPADTENWINRFAARNGATPEQARDMLNRSGKIGQLRESILEERILDWLIGKATVVPVSKVEKKS